MALKGEQLFEYTNGMRTLMDPAAFQAATTRQRDFGLFTIDAAPGENLSGVYEKYSQFFYGDKKNLQFANEAVDALNKYLLKHGLNEEGVQKRNRSIFEKIRQLLYLHINYQTLEAGAAIFKKSHEDWNEAIQRNRINTALFLGNIKLQYQNSTLLVSAAALTANGLQINPNVYGEVQRYVGEIKHLCDPEVAIPTAVIIASTRYQPIAQINREGAFNYFQKFMDFVNGLIDIIAEKFKNFFVAMYSRLRAKDITAIAPIVSAICLAIKHFLEALAKSINLAQSGFNAATHLVDGVLTTLRRLDLAAAHKAVGQFHEYWRIIDESLMWGEKQNQYRDAYGFIKNVADIIATIFDAGTALFKTIVCAVDLLVNLIISRVQQHYINETLRLAQVWVSKFEPEIRALGVEKLMIGETDDDTWNSAEYIPQTRMRSGAEDAGDVFQNRMVTPVDAYQKYRDTMRSRDVSDLDRAEKLRLKGMDRAVNVGIASDALRESAKILSDVVERNAELIRSFNPHLYSLEDFMNDKEGCFTIYLNHMCSASPIITACIVNSGVMSDPITVTTAKGYVDESNEERVIGYMRLAGITARNVYAKSNFQFAPAPTIASFGAVSEKWKGWVAGAQLNTNPNMLNFTS